LSPTNQERVAFSFLIPFTMTNPIVVGAYLQGAKIYLFVVSSLTEADFTDASVVSKLYQRSKQIANLLV
jgi:hypothetical protein